MINVKMLCLTEFGLELNDGNQSAKIDFNSDDHSYRLTVWESGECDIEIIDNDFAERFVLIHKQLRDRDQVREHIKALGVLVS